MGNQCRQVNGSPITQRRAINAANEEGFGRWTSSVVMQMPSAAALGLGSPRHHIGFALAASLAFGKDHDGCNTDISAA